jgi:hypothetical protein
MGYLEGDKSFKPAYRKGDQCWMDRQIPIEEIAPHSTTGVMARYNK